jgi:hypothetical protein
LGGGGVIRGSRARTPGTLGVISLAIGTIPVAFIILAISITRTRSTTSLPSGLGHLVAGATGTITATLGQANICGTQNYCQRQGENTRKPSPIFHKSLL